MSTSENATATMSTSEVATGTMPTNVCNVAATMSAAMPTPTSATVTTAASESVSGERQAAKRENCGQRQD